MFDEIFARVLRPLDPPLCYERTSDWWRDFQETTHGIALPVDRAIASAARVDRLAYVLAAGYIASIQALIPSLPRDVLASFAVSEEGGVHPRAILSRLEPDGDSWLLRGKKRWVTLGLDAERVYVAARAGGTDERPSIKLVRVDPRRTEVERTSMPPTPFVSELANAELWLTGVRVSSSDILDGDGYSQYVKPFRTIEDVHVHTALLAWLVAMASRSRWPHERREELLSAMVAGRALCAADPRSPLTHIAVSGLLREGQRLSEACDDLWTSSDPHAAALWQRDRALFLVAQKARIARSNKAWEAIDGEELG